MAIIKIYPDKDAYVFESQPNFNFGDAGYLSVYDWIGVNLYRSFIRIPTYPIGLRDTIQSVKLKIYVFNFYEPSSETEQIHRVIADWEEMAITWNNQPAVSDLIIGTNILGSGWFEVDITNAFKNWWDGTWLNYGIRWKYTNESVDKDNEIDFYSKDYIANPALRLYAEVEYIPGQQDYAFIM